VGFKAQDDAARLLRLTGLAFYFRMIIGFSPDYFK
jgi:hypothetical protein